jgi:hypothetical protein
LGERDRDAWRRKEKRERNFINERERESKKLMVWRLINE